MLAPRRGDGHAVIAPMSPAAFINPAVIQRTAFLASLAEGRPPEPFRYREGVLLRGGAASLGVGSRELRQLGVGAGALPKDQAKLRENLRHEPDDGGDIAVLRGTEIRVRIEDALLAGRFGAAFEDYRRRVAAYIPFVR